MCEKVSNYLCSDRLRELAASTDRNKDCEVVQRQCYPIWIKLTVVQTSKEERIAQARVCDHQDRTKDRIEPGYHRNILKLGGSAYGVHLLALSNPLASSPNQRSSIHHAMVLDKVQGMYYGFMAECTYPAL
jgi:hypothetical protein